MARMKFEIVLAPEAANDFRRLSARDRSIVRTALEVHLRFEPEKLSKSRIKRLRGMQRPQYRLRVEDLRIFYDVQEDRVKVLAIVSKPTATEWLHREGERE